MISSIYLPSHPSMQYLEFMCLVFNFQINPTPLPRRAHHLHLLALHVQKDHDAVSRVEVGCRREQQIGTDRQRVSAERRSARHQVGSCEDRASKH